MQLYIETIIIYNDPYQPSSIMECHTGVERRSYVVGKMVVAQSPVVAGLLPSFEGRLMETLVTPLQARAGLL